ncbi:MAG: glycosyl transferase family 1, partial [Microcoleus sp. SU_5_3]|nr:glycosyl transferase family 1 [Microcoleus sp. SU_5_3]
MKILMFSSTFPYPPTQGGTQVRTWNLLKYLSSHHYVILGTLRSPDVTDAAIDELRQHVAELAVFPHPLAPPQPRAGLFRGNHGEIAPTENQGFVGAMPPYPPSTEGGLNRILGKVHRFNQFVLSGTPPNVISSYSPAMQHWADELVAFGKCDVVTSEHSVNEIYVRPEWREKVLTVANIHSSVWGTCRQMLATGTSEKPLRDRLNLPLLARYEKRYCSKFSRIVATTETDRQQLLELLSPADSRRGGAPCPPP